MTEPETLQQLDRTCVRHRNRKLAYFSGCDYFRLASHPAVLQAALDGLKKFGLNVAASRLTTGNHKIYQALERELANFFDADDALLLPSGYTTGLAVAQALAGSFSHALVDERAHPALLDAADLLDCPVLKFKHRDESIFAEAIARCGSGSRPIVLTDGMFSYNGSVAPLKAYLKHLPEDGLILVDDAHGAGVLGKTGKGSLEAEGVSRGRIVQCISLSKAIGAYGGAILGTPELRKAILERSRLFVGGTPLPLPLASAALQSVKILETCLETAGADARRLAFPAQDIVFQKKSVPRDLVSRAERGISKRLLEGDKTLRRRLIRNSTYVKASLRAAGVGIPESPGPIVPLHFRNQSEVTALRKDLLAAKIFPPFLKYPGGPAKGYFRFVISSEHSRAQLDNLVAVLKQL
jgi:7-keto-8-aminopelargonate synthetase-like enzyme